MTGAKWVPLPLASVARRARRLARPSCICGGAPLRAPLPGDAPPAAAVLGTTYFYGDAGMLYAVHNVHTDAAVFEAAGFDFREPAVRDVAPVGAYLVGVADGAAALVVVKADFTGHAALAIDDALPGVVFDAAFAFDEGCLLYTSPSPRDS